MWTGAHQLEKGSGENRPSGEGDCPDGWAKLGVRPGVALEGSGRHDLAMSAPRASLAGPGGCPGSQDRGCWPETAGGDRGQGGSEEAPGGSMRQERGRGQRGWGAESVGATAELTWTGCGGEGLRRRVTCAAGRGRVGPADIGLGMGPLEAPARGRRTVSLSHVESWGWGEEAGILATQRL